MLNRTDRRSGRRKPESKVATKAAEFGRQARQTIRRTRDNAVEQIQHGASDYVCSAAQSIRLGGANMRQDGHGGSANALDRAAGVLEEVGVELRSQDLLHAASEITVIAKRRPGVVLGVLAGTGFLLAFALRKKP